VLPHHMHMGCMGLASLSFSQLDALEVLHHAALARCAHTLLVRSAHALLQDSGTATYHCWHTSALHMCSSSTSQAVLQGGKPWPPALALLAPPAQARAVLWPKPCMRCRVAEAKLDLVRAQERSKASEKTRWV